jgi:hypothetical protein
MFDVRNPPHPKTGRSIGALLLGAVLALPVGGGSARAQALFGAGEVDPSRFLLVAAPIGTSGERYQLNSVRFVDRYVSSDNVSEILKDVDEFPLKNYILEVNVQNNTDTTIYVTTKDFVIKDHVVSDSIKKGKTITEMVDSLFEWYNLTDSGLRLRCGELTAQEVRTIRAVLNSIVGA